MSAAPSRFNVAIKAGTRISWPLALICRSSYSSPVSYLHRGGAIGRFQSSVGKGRLLVREPIPGRAPSGGGECCARSLASLAISVVRNIAHLALYASRSTQLWNEAPPQPIGEISLLICCKKADVGVRSQTA